MVKMYEHKTVIYWCSMLHFLCVPAIFKSRSSWNYRYENHKPNQIRSSQIITVKSGGIFLDCLVSTDVGNGRSCGGLINGKVALILETRDFKGFLLTEK